MIHFYLVRFIFGFNWRYAFSAIVLYFRVPVLLYIPCARMYADHTPFVLILHVFRVHTGNDLLGPRKHLRVVCAFLLLCFVTHLFHMVVRSCRDWGLYTSQSFHGGDARVFIRFVLDAIAI